ncbi:MAG: class I SAM-dependent rRNA methyltransferase [Gammaproteobacteria bacterium]|nr:class I SAM-dependent rRNA methyltransferase [Gammaproteobacteria bacterium]
MYLNKREEKRLLAGHLWVFSNEIDTKRSALKDFTPGDCVNIVSSSGKVLGSAYVNPHSLIAARKYSDQADKAFDLHFIKGRIQDALALREQMFDKPYYRLIFSEGDFLPGLIIDRFDDTFVLQLNTAGVDRIQDMIIAVLEEMFNPTNIVLRNSTGSRQLENLPKSVSIAKGDLSAPVYCEENDTRFLIDVMHGQKTGWFYDQRFNRKNTLDYVKDKTVLDVFSYSGSWAVSAAKCGAQSVTAIDISQPALDSLIANAKENQVEGKVTAICDDAFNAMRELKKAGTQYDVVIIDPPAFIKRKKDLKEGLQAYQRANQIAMSLVKRGGLFISSSCSYHMSLSNLQNALLRSSRGIKRPLQIIQYGGQGPDHPIHPAIEETNYLKTIFARVL